MLGDGQLYFRQWRSGRDFAVGNEIADALANYAYALGDRETATAVLVDPSHAPLELLAALDADGMRCVGAVLTHFHADHAGGELQGYAIEGVAELVTEAQLPVHLHEDDAAFLLDRSSVTPSALSSHRDGDHLVVGELDVTLVHTPGHTPGSQCLYGEDLLLTGDTLFILGCGRTDGPGGDPAALYESLQSRLGEIPDATVVYPGHDYARKRYAPLGELRQSNPVLFAMAEQEWVSRFSG